MTAPVIEHMNRAAIDAAAAAAVLSSPATSTWLQTALRKALDRDCVDAASDAQILADLLGRRCDAMLEGR